MKYKAIKGVKDILPKEIGKWHFIEKTARELFERYCYYEARPPIFEKTAIFTRSIGEDTDIVEKEMYTFEDKGNESITLRPEGTASIVRAYVENQLYNPPSLVKLYYMGPMFRYERPQSGRFRQFYQIGVEAFGSDDPAVDAEVIFMLMTFYQLIGLKNLELNLNSIGCPECRPAYKDRLIKYFETRLESLCEICNQRLKKNPLRILDCKNKSCTVIADDAPTIDQSRCEKCETNFTDVQKYLDKLGAKFKLNPKLVRGLDYYTQTAFEVLSGGLGAQNAVAGGGRYNGLVKEFDGPQTPAVGFAMGVERIVSLLEDQEKFSFKPTVFIVSLGEESKEKAFEILNELRMGGISSDWNIGQGSLKSQMKKADRSGAGFVCIIGENELKNEKLVLRNMKNSNQEEVPIENILKEIIIQVNRLKAGGN